MNSEEEEFNEEEYEDRSDELNDENKGWIILIAIFIIALLAYLFTAGKINFAEKLDDLKTFKEKRDLAARWNNKLKGLIETKKRLKEKLEKRFKIAFTIARIMFVILYALMILGVGFLFEMISVDGLLKILGISVTIFYVIYFIWFGKHASFNEIIKYFKNWLQNKMYLKYLNIDDQILAHEEQLTLNYKELLELNKKIEDIKSNQ